MLIRRVGGTDRDREGRVPLVVDRSAVRDLPTSFPQLARAKEAKRLRIALDENAATLTFVSSGTSRQIFR